ncbi:hypothetical protein O1611_g8716 [Lasiodiplodia mahajangana]|uniref:Uncharacterized protein n=1 Tax=Lasiodiplodia mahajangana TaxID=1108764 RepID=A0ACC2JBR8_9PEZI|nr:hypothetical protein O1611_g8716 [Lasiodiplodia mahajangana]
MAPLKEATDALNRAGDARKRKKNPRVERVKKSIRDYGGGRRLANRDIAYYTLYLAEYRQLLEDIRNDEDLKYIFDNELRYEYTADNRGKNNKREKQFAIRMPTYIHEFLLDEIDTVMKVRREAIRRGAALCEARLCTRPRCTNGNTRSLAERLLGYRNGIIKPSLTTSRNEKDEKSPDLSYRYSDGKLSSDGVGKNPGLVIEVGWSQKSSELKKKCEWYIENSNGWTRTVIGVDLYDLYRCYPVSKTRPKGFSKLRQIEAIEKDVANMAEASRRRKACGKIYVWRAEIDSRTNKAIAILDENAPTIFRDQYGKPADRVAFQLSLEDFISARDIERIGAFHNVDFSVKSKQLCDIFDIALKEQVLSDRIMEEAEEEEGSQEK